MLLFLCYYVLIGWALGLFLVPLFDAVSYRRRMKTFKGWSYLPGKGDQGLAHYFPKVLFSTGFLWPLGLVQLTLSLLKAQTHSDTKLSKISQPTTQLSEEHQTLLDNYRMNHQQTFRFLTDSDNPKGKSLWIPHVLQTGDSAYARVLVPQVACGIPLMVSHVIILSTDSATIFRVCDPYTGSNIPVEGVGKITKGPKSESLQAAMATCNEDAEWLRLCETGSMLDRAKFLMDDMLAFAKSLDTTDTKIVPNPEALASAISTMEKIRKSTDDPTE